eukprot:5096052-Prorocentrum_lima.AAC.1
MKQSNNSAKRALLRCWRLLSKDNQNYLAKLTMQKFWENQSAKRLQLLKMMGKKKRAQHQRQKKSIRQAKKEWLANLAEEAEQEERTGRSWEAWQIIKRFKEAMPQATKGIKDRQGQLQQEPQQMVNTWKAHWEALLGKTAAETRQQEEEERQHSQAPPPQQRDKREATQEEQQRLTPWPEEEIPTEIELAQLLKNMKIGKAPGTDK